MPTREGNTVADFEAIKQRLMTLPEDRRMQLVVRSMPFGDIVENDTRLKHVDAADIEPGRAYELCRSVKQR